MPQSDTFYSENIQVEFSLKTGTSTPLFITKKIIIAIQIPYCHYFKAKGLFGLFLVKRLSSYFKLALTRYKLLEEDTSDY